MPDILVVADEIAANELVHDGQSVLPPMTETGTGSLGPFDTNWSATATISGGTVDLVPSNIIRIVDCEVHYNLHFAISLDLNTILPSFCLPQICIDINFLNIHWCTPLICFSWPTVTIPMNHSGVVTFTNDFMIHTYQSGPNWLIDLKIVGVPNLQITGEAGAILAAIGAVAALVLSPIPFIGPFLALAVALIMAAIGIAGVTGFLGPILNLFVSGLRINVFNEPKHFEVVPANPSQFDPAVYIELDLIRAHIANSGEDELLIVAEISPP